MSIVIGCILLIVSFGMVLVGRPAAGRESAALLSKAWSSRRLHILAALVIAAAGISFILNGLPR